MPANKTDEIANSLGRLHAALDAALSNKQETMPANKTDEIANSIWRLHAALDAVYGKGWSRVNPQAVAHFMHAVATHKLATEIGDLREILGSGTGAITVGLESHANNELG